MPSLASEFGRRGPSLESWLKPEWLELRRGWDNRILSDAQSHKKLFLSHSSWPSWHHRLCRDQDCKSSSMAFLAPLSRRQRQNMAISLSNGELSAASFAHLRKHAWPRAGLKGQQNMSATLLAGSLLHTNCTPRAEKAELLSSSNRVWTARPCLLLRLPISSCPGVFFGIQSIVGVHVIWMTWDVVSNAFGDFFSEIQRCAF